MGEHVFIEVWVFQSPILQKELQCIRYFQNNSLSKQFYRGEVILVNKCNRQLVKKKKKRSLRKKCPYSKFFWSVFSNIRTEYEEIFM